MESPRNAKVSHDTDAIFNNLSRRTERILAKLVKLIGPEFGPGHSALVKRMTLFWLLYHSLEQYDPIVSGAYSCLPGNKGSRRIVEAHLNHLLEKAQQTDVSGENLEKLFALQNDIFLARQKATKRISRAIFN